MAKFEALDHGVSPPNDRNWVMIERGSSGSYYVRSCTAGNKDQAISESLSSRVAAGVIAQKLATTLGADTIYTRDFPT